MSRKDRATPLRNESSIVDGWLYFEDVRQAKIDTELFADLMGDGYTRAVRVVSLENRWQEREWMSNIDSVDFDLSLQMTLRLEERSGRMYWYAYRRVGGKLYKRYVGSNEQVTTKRLVQIAQKLPGV